MERLAVFYFSGTGNTRYITEYLCRKLSSNYSCEVRDLMQVGNPAEVLRDADVVLIAFPIYGSAPPIPVRNFVHQCGTALRDKRTIIVETQYFFSGDGTATIGRTLKKYGAKLIGAEIFNMPNNLADCKAFPVKNGEEIQKKLKKAKQRADRFAKRILNGRARLRGFSVFSHGVGFFSQRKFWMQGEKAKRDRLKVDPRRCVGCGLCVKKCPVGNLRLEGGRACASGECVLCYRCVNLCPKKAITLIGSEPPEVQYKGPF